MKKRIFVSLLAILFALPVFGQTVTVLDVRLDHTPSEMKSKGVSVRVHCPDCRQDTDDDLWFNVKGINQSFGPFNTECLPASPPPTQCALSTLHANWFPDTTKILKILKTDFSALEYKAGDKLEFGIILPQDNNLRAGRPCVVDVRSTKHGLLTCENNMTEADSTGTDDTGPGTGSTLPDGPTNLRANFSTSSYWNLILTMTWDPPYYSDGSIMGYEFKLFAGGPTNRVFPALINWRATDNMNSHTQPLPFDEEYYTVHCGCARGDR